MLFLLIRRGIDDRPPVLPPFAMIYRVCFRRSHLSDSSTHRLLTRVASNFTTLVKPHVPLRPKPDILPVIFRSCSQPRQLPQQALWSGRWESNPRPKLGKLLYCHCTTPALILLILATFVASKQPKILEREQNISCAFEVACV